MEISLRPYQDNARLNVIEAWDHGIRFAMLVMPTGAGKTVVLAKIIKDEGKPTCVIAHRQELVSQISLALARNGIRHRIIGPTKVVSFVVKLHREELGSSFYDPHSNTAVAGVDTIIRRHGELKKWLKKVSLWVIDEAHHLLRENKWGKAAAMFPNARGLGVTATPERADGKGLGAHAEGVFEKLIQGPSMRELIDMGFLTRYRIFGPQTRDLVLDSVNISRTTGDYNKDSLRKAIRRSQIVGDVVQHYLRLAKGKPGITFTTDVETAHQIADDFNANGVPAAAVSAKTPDADRVDLVRKFRNRELMQLVNVDLFGEGFDLPAIEVISMARPTQSIALLFQQFGRALRPMPGKTHAIIIDHVNNIVRIGLPDARTEWSLDGKAGRWTRDDGMNLTTCPKCAYVHERYRKACPGCKYRPKPVSMELEQIEGDLTELTAEKLDELRRRVAEANRSVDEERERLESIHAPRVGVLTGAKRHGVLLKQRESLRTVMDHWAGLQRQRGLSLEESYRKFYLSFGTDVLSVQTLKSKETVELTGRIEWSYFRGAADDTRTMGGKMEGGSGGDSGAKGDSGGARYHPGEATG